MSEHNGKPKTRNRGHEPILDREGPKRIGRPTELTPELLATIVNHIRLGGYLESAADFAGVRRQTVRNWLREGHKQPGSIYQDFLIAVKKANAEAQQGNIAHILAARGKNWTAAAWMLERRWPNRWGKHERVEHTGKGGGPIRSMSIQVVNLLDRLPVETVRAIMEAREQAENEALAIEHRPDST